MGRSIKGSTAVDQEFFKLSFQLTQTADDANKCLKVLARKLGAYDRRHGVRLLKTSKHFMRNDIRVAKEMIADLQYVAKRIRRSNSLSKSEIVAARNSMISTADAMNDLKTAGRTYDQNYDTAEVADIIPNVVEGDADNTKPDERLFRRKSTKRSSSSTTADTVENVVRSTLHDSFSGFTDLNAQVVATDNALLPSIATQAKEAMVKAANKIMGDLSSSPTDKDDNP